LNRIAIVLLAALVSIGGYATQPDPYPNEVGDLKFYSDYLAPLLPDRSDSKQVIQVLGPTQGRELPEWKISVLYSCNGDATACLHGQVADRLYQIVVTPRHRVSLSHQKFPSSFVHVYGAVSEINVTCDVYTDRFGLEYWVVSNDFPSYKKGDLLEVLYGAPHQITPPANVHSELPKS
jgi:hypothetical protein